jgi:hypothetical protein
MTTGNKLLLAGITAAAFGITAALLLLRDEPQSATSLEALVPPVGAPLMIADATQIAPPKPRTDQVAPAPTPPQEEVAPTAVANAQKMPKQSKAKEGEAEKSAAEEAPAAPAISPEERAEAERLLRKIAELTETSNLTLRTAIGELRMLPIKTPRLASLRDVCADFFGTLGEGAELEDHVEKEIAQREGKSTPKEVVATLRQKLGTAEEAALQAELNADDCGIGAENVRQVYGL